jgi:NADH:ubiquinone oxidoreductase subunit E
MTCSSPTDNWTQVEAECRAALPPEVVEFIEQCRQMDHPQSRLIAVLHRLQGIVGYLATKQLDAVAQLLGVPAAKVAGVATFYHFFHLTPRGQFAINLCMGTACYVKGADKVADKLREELGIDFGQTTGDGMFSLHSTCCLGTCGLAPVIMINEDVHPRVTPDQIPSLLEKAIASRKA